MKIIRESEFKSMPWKNGKGITTELVRVKKSKELDFDFRISKAIVNTNSDFSIYKGINRHLLLLSGDGLILRQETREIRLDSLFKVHSFSGDENIYCELIKSPCIDFNIMVNPHYAAVEINIYSNKINFFETLDFEAYIYLIKGQVLIYLNRGEKITFQEVIHNLAENEVMILVKVFTN